jgi:ASC-1-like (ASCH) protein
MKRDREEQTPTEVNQATSIIPEIFSQLKKIATLEPSAMIPGTHRSKTLDAKHIKNMQNGSKQFEVRSNEKPYVSWEKGDIIRFYTGQLFGFHDEGDYCFVRITSVKEHADLDGLLDDLMQDHKLGLTLPGVEAREEAKAIYKRYLKTDKVLIFGVECLQKSEIQAFTQQYEYQHLQDALNQLNRFAGYAAIHFQQAKKALLSMAGNQVARLEVSFESIAEVKAAIVGDVNQAMSRFSLVNSNEASLAIKGVMDKTKAFFKQYRTFKDSCFTGIKALEQHPSFARLTSELHQKLQQCLKKLTKGETLSFQKKTTPKKCLAIFKEREELLSEAIATLNASHASSVAMESACKKSRA